MREEPVDVVRRELMLLSQLQQEVNAQGHNVFGQHACVLLQREERLREPLALREECPPPDTAVSVLLASGIHAGLLRIGERCDLYPVHTQGETLWGEKLPRLATIYILVLKLIYDEQMQNVSTSSQIVTTLGAVNGKAGEFRVLQSIPSATEMRRTIALLKKYQLIEPLDLLEELNESTRIVIYPSIHAVLAGDDIRELLETFSEEEHFGKEGETAAVQGTLEDLPE